MSGANGAEELVAWLVEDSIREGQIVHVPLSAVGGAASGAYTALLVELESECDDWVAAGELEYWGRDTDGDEWCIHVERAAAPVEVSR